MNNGGNFRNRGKKLGILATLASFLIGCTGSNIQWRDPFTSWRIHNKEAKTIAKVAEPSDVTDYEEKLEKRVEENTDILKKLGLMNVDNPDKPDYEAVRKKAEEIITDYDKKVQEMVEGKGDKPLMERLSYPINEVQAVYSLIENIKEDSIASFRLHELDKVDEKLKQTIIGYHTFMGEISSSGQEKYNHFLAGMIIARSMDDRELFDEFYSLSKEIPKTERLIDSESHLLSYPNIHEEMRKGYNADRTAWRTWKWGSIIGAALYFAIKNNMDDGNGSSGPTDGGGEGPGGPGGN